MNILFLSLSSSVSLNQSGIYADLLREFVKHNHSVYAVSPADKLAERDEIALESEFYTVLKVKTEKIQKVKNNIVKGINTLLVGEKYANAIKKYYSSVHFDLILYSTPPITFLKAIKYVAKRDNAKTFLLLKDIFPQNAVDIGMLSKSGIKGVIYRYFRSQEKKLYKISNYIGCMSKANAEYIMKNNPNVLPDRVNICPNSIDISSIRKITNKDKIRKRYGIPLDKTVFIYGGNLGKPQDIPFVINCLKANENYNDRFFVICGTGTEYPKLKAYIDECHPENILLINGLPKDEYEGFVGCCDVGLIFLDHRFTIPNFPSRILSYMKNCMPVLACTDANTDVGKVIVDENFGWWCESNSVDDFVSYVNKAVDSNLSTMGNNAFSYLCEEFSVSESYEIILKSIDGSDGLLNIKQKP